MIYAFLSNFQPNFNNENEPILRYTLKPEK